jgi:hypothetical protein
VCREIQHAGFTREGILGAIAVMHVKINYCDAFELIPGQCVLSGYRDVIKNTKAHGAVGGGMMTRGPRKAKNPFGDSCHQIIYTLARCANST